jgi:hypothetical protein
MEEIAKKGIAAWFGGGECAKIEAGEKTAEKKCRKEFGGTEPDHRTLNNSMDTW